MAEGRQQVIENDVVDDVRFAKRRPHIKYQPVDRRIRMIVAACMMGSGAGPVAD